MGMGASAAGLILTGAAFHLHAPLLLLPVALLLGAGYGLVLVSGLRQTHALGEPSDAARLNAVFYALAYVGFAVPLVFSLTTSSLHSQEVFLLLGAVVAAGTGVCLGGRWRRDTAQTSAETSAEMGVEFSAESGANISAAPECMPPNSR
jgi:hypothetical protein